MAITNANPATGKLLRSYEPLSDAEAAKKLDLAAAAFAVRKNTSFAHHGERDYLIDAIEAGMVFVNKMLASDARVPFGGVKYSGFGRELGPFGIREFTNIKTVWIER